MILVMGIFRFRFQIGKEREREREKGCLENISIATGLLSDTLC